MKLLLSLIFFYVSLGIAADTDSISSTILLEDVKGAFRQAEKSAIKKWASGDAEVSRSNEYSCSHYLKRLDKWLLERNQTSQMIESDNLNAKNISDLLEYWNETLGLGANISYGTVDWTWNVESTEEEIRNSLMILNYGIETGNNFFSDFIFVDPLSVVAVEGGKLKVTMPLSLMDICSNTKFRLLAIKNCKISKIEEINNCDVKDSEMFIGTLKNLKSKLNKAKKKRSRYKDASGGEK